MLEIPDQVRNDRYTTFYGIINLQAETLRRGRRVQNRPRLQTRIGPLSKMVLEKYYIH